MEVAYSVEGYVFVWDSEKADLNLEKHGISFEQACDVFFDVFYRMYPDTCEYEERWNIIGRSHCAHTIHPLCVVAVEKGEEAWRIVSARLASRSERRRYEEDDDTD
ncbi:MAG: BrnT family toxin [Desulfomonile tiedjei]|uniref:BrnT family toxin n=1 Tax=Desulfomonile tiedjei TaxID=2358 RepID=A0A9D6Z1X4_9BACT|nr:BrnT family toxin [Desulfomonile tiedjei]